MRSIALLAVLAACGDNIRGDIAIVAPESWAYPIRELVELTPYPGLVVGDVAAGQRIVVVDDDELASESYQLDNEDFGFTVRAHDALGAQYGVSAALESLGFRFRHPYDPFVPAIPRKQPFEALGTPHVPEIRVRGLHLHTLHPIEGYFAMWEPGHFDEARRVIDWLVKNRGNYIQWAGLDDILNPARHAAWHEYTRQIIDYAHARGIRIGFDIQLYGQSNIQFAFDLSDDRTGMVPIADEIAKRLPVVTDGLPWDVIQLSFGEFFSSDPAKFVAAIDEVRKQVRVKAPQAEMHALVHVGKTQRVTYMGEDLIYYMLVKFADASIVPDIHTVMYYNLFEDAGGAYEHDLFDEHLAFLRDRICAGKPAAYHPETGYWIAFDNSVPTFLPLYSHSRWLDLALLGQLACGKPLDEHLIFSTGWEWGYWLGDYTSLRASFERGGDVRALTHAAFAPDLGDAAASIVDELAEVEHAALIEQRLAAYFAARDTVIDAGDQIGIHSQPDRMTFDDLAATTSDARSAFESDVLVPFEAFAKRLEQLAADFDELSLPESRWSRELRAGFHINKLRARYVARLYRATLAQLAGNTSEARSQRDAAKSLLDDARNVVARRHLDLHDPDGADRWIKRIGNSTAYAFGYLFMADTLCYWERELVQVDGILGNSTAAVPACVL